MTRKLIVGSVIASLALAAVIWVTLFTAPSPAWRIAHEAYLQRPTCRAPMQTNHALLTLAPDITPETKARLARIEVTSAALSKPIIATLTPDKKRLYYPDLFSEQGHTETLRISCDVFGCELSFLAYVAEYQPQAPKGDFTMVLSDAQGAEISRHQWQDLPIPSKADPATAAIFKTLLNRIAVLQGKDGTASVTISDQPVTTPDMPAGAILQIATAATGRQETAVELDAGRLRGQTLSLPVSGQLTYLAALVWQQPAGQQQSYEAKLELINTADPYMRCK